MRHLALAVIGGVLALTQPSLAVEPPAGFILNETPTVVPEVQFEDAAGQPRQLKDFHGKVVLLNLWATWCAPCRTEMPALDRLQAKLGGTEFEVLPLSLDRKGPEAVEAFYKEIGVTQLGLWIDRSSKANRTLRAVGLPTTILIDRTGRELGRLIGPAEWDTPEMIAFFQALIAEGDAASKAPAAQ